MKRILILGYYGFSNSGDDAILASICRDILDIDPKSEITVFSNDPQSTEKEYGVRAAYRFNTKAVRREILNTDILLVGGGSLLQDKTSSRSLFYYLSILWYAKLHKKKCMLIANGIGPIDKGFNRMLTKWIANKVDIITLREKLSAVEVKDLGITKPRVYVTADPVFSLKPEPVDVEAIFRDENIDTQKPLAAVLFRTWGHSDEYVIKMAKVCDYIIEQYDMNILLIPMKYPSDIAVLEQILQHMNHPGFLLKQKYKALTMIEIIGSTKLVLSMRLHALLYSAIKNIPMIGFVYDPKVEYYLRELNMFSAGAIEELDVDTVKEDIDLIMKEYTAIQKNLAVKVDAIREKALENKVYLRELMGK